MAVLTRFLPVRTPQGSQRMKVDFCQRVYFFANAALNCTETFDTLLKSKKDSKPVVKEQIINYFFTVSNQVKSF